MDAIVYPGTLSGSVRAIASKSMAHRLLILAALTGGSCEVSYNATSEDIEATKRCLDALGERLAVLRSKSGQEADTGPQGPELRTTSGSPVMLPCGESGSTLRFLLPVVGALGCDAVFLREGRLPSRPLSPFDAELEAHGMIIEASEADGTLVVGGKLRGGSFVLPGDVSSQFISGLLLASPLLDAPLDILIKAPVQSRPYIEMTVNALRVFDTDVRSEKISCAEALYERLTPQTSGLLAPERISVEGDWSNAAFWLAAGALENDGIAVTGLDLASVQGDRAILAALASFGARIARKGNAARATRFSPRPTTLDVSSIPDLVPPLAAVAALTEGVTRLTNAGRLRLKESDRLSSVCAVINQLGGKAHVEGDDLVIEGVERLKGATVDAFNDHRIAMMAALLAVHAADPVTIVGADCVKKSYPGFWDDYAALGGKVSQ